MADITQDAAGDDSTSEQPLDLGKLSVITKFRNSADITNAALGEVIQACVEGGDIAEICRKGDAYIDGKTAGIYNKKVEGEKPTKGVAFPTCVSVNEICGNFCPFKSESQKLKKGDVCKINLGCHIDGCITLAAHTVVVAGADGTFSDDEPQENKTSITGRKADVLMAAWTAAEAALRTVKIGRTNKEVTQVINLAMDQFECSPLRGVLSHQMKQHVIDGNKVIILKETADEKVDEFEFEVNEVYAIDILATTGDGKTKETDIRTTIYKRDSEQSYNLKTQMGRKFVHQVTTRFPILPFTACAFDDEKMARAGVSECVRHALLVPYPVVAEKSGELVAHFQFTVLLLPGGTKKVTGLPFAQQSLVKSSHAVKDETLRDLLSRSANPPKPRKPKSGAAARAAATAAEGAEKATDPA